MPIPSGKITHYYHDVELQRPSPVGIVCQSEYDLILAPWKEGGMR